MKRRLEGLMAKYGQTVRLTPRTGGEAVERRAFLQPILKQRDGLPAAATPLGAVSRQRWLYIGGWSQAIAPGDETRTDTARCLRCCACVKGCPGDCVAWGELRLVAQEALPLWWRDSVLCYRAILRREREECT